MESSLGYSPAHSRSFRPRGGQESPPICAGNPTCLTFLVLCGSVPIQVWKAWAGSGRILRQNRAARAKPGNGHLGPGTRVTPAGPGSRRLASSYFACHGSAPFRVGSKGRLVCPGRAAAEHVYITANRMPNVGDFASDDCERRVSIRRTRLFPHPGSLAPAWEPTFAR